ncbi:hypothetical protein SAMN02745673_04849 [Marinactinospora thermotolerans DSM 45154]|uniref:DUF5753 domain-containing protein n=1 Tax=Marinactinospora thermotolerans DSM 45154 TaxID=1122192 RepID=A0A1T4TEJ7_9ACTN|nr:hypothetical protein SAMN02745673_04849 [Marinactinospora thermotolerans DSM 45154]
MVPSMISQIETGVKKPRREHAVALDRELMTGGELTELWDNLFREIQSPSWFQDGLLLEREATEIRDYQTLILPGLLQTPAYARAILATGTWHFKSEDPESRVAARMKRKEIIGPGGPILWFVVGHEALRREVGSREVMLEQFRHLLELIEAGNIRFQVTMPDSPTHLGTSGCFRTMSFHSKPPVAFAEYVTGEHILRRESDVRSYNMLFSMLQGESFSSSESAAEIRKRIDQYEQARQPRLAQEQLQQ